MPVSCTTFVYNRSFDQTSLLPFKLLSHIARSNPCILNPRLPHILVQFSPHKGMHRASVFIESLNFPFVLSVYTFLVQGLRSSKRVRPSPVLCAYLCKFVSDKCTLNLLPLISPNISDVRSLQREKRSQIPHMWCAVFAYANTAHPTSRVLSYIAITE